MISLKGIKGFKDGVTEDRAVTLIKFYGKIIKTRTFP